MAQSLKIQLLFLSLFFQFSLLANQDSAVDKLSGTISIAPEKNFIQADLTYHCVPEHHSLTDSLSFIFPISFQIDTVSLSKDYHFAEIIDTTTRLGHLFKTLLITKKKDAVMQPFDFQIKYKGYYELPNDFLPENWPKNWIEVSANTLIIAPLPADFATAQLDLTMNITEGYDFIAAGKVTQKSKTQYLFTSERPTTGLYFLLGKDLDIQELNSKYGKIIIASYQTNDSLIQEIAAAVSFSMDFYNSTFGKQAPRTDVKIIVRPLPDWDASFAHFNSYSATYDPQDNFYKNQPFYFGIYAHEMAHFWWLHANAATTENWINESFAEYVSLLVERAYYGEVHFEKQLAEHQEKADKVPAEISLNNYKRYGNYDKTMAYSEGTLVLHFLHQQVGDADFYAFLSQVDEEKLGTTAAIFDLIEKKFSGDWIAEIKTQLGL